MGAIAEAMVAYARPLIDQTDGSVEQMENAFAISHVVLQPRVVAGRRSGAGTRRDATNPQDG